MFVSYSTTTKKEKKCCSGYVYQLNTGEDDEEAGSSSINKRTKSSIAEFCLTLLQIINERHREEKEQEEKKGKKKMKKTMTMTNANKDGHSQIVKGTRVCLCACIVSNKGIDIQMCLVSFFKL